MLLIAERIEQYLNECILREIVISNGDKVFHRGKLRLYKIDGCRIVLLWADGTESTIPYPYNAYRDRDVFFDYRLEALAEKNYTLLFMLQSMSRRRKAKFYNVLTKITIA